jgi:hypothetical protein
MEPHFLDLGTSWRLVVSFTPQLLYPRGKSRQYPLDRRLGGLILFRLSQIIYPVTAAVWLVSFGLIILSILHQTIAYASSVHNNLDSLG